MSGMLGIIFSLGVCCRSATRLGTWILLGWDKVYLRCSCHKLLPLQRQSSLWRSLQSGSADLWGPRLLWVPFPYFSGHQDVNIFVSPSETFALSCHLFTLQFGGKLVSLENTKLNPQQPTAHIVHVSQVVTETAFLKRSDQLQATLSAGSFVDFCQEKIDVSENEFEKTIWSFLKVQNQRETFAGKNLNKPGESFQ